MYQEDKKGMNLEIKSTTWIVPGGPLREEKITTIPSQDHTQHIVMQAMLRKIKQIRTTHRTEEMEDSITETEMEVTRSNLKESMMTKRAEYSTESSDGLMRGSNTRRTLVKQKNSLRF